MTLILFLEKGKFKNSRWKIENSEKEEKEGENFVKNLSDLVSPSDILIFDDTNFLFSKRKIWRLEVGNWKRWKRIEKKEKNFVENEIDFVALSDLLPLMVVIFFEEKIVDEFEDW